MKQGDKCRIVGKKANHGFEINDEVAIGMYAKNSTGPKLLCEKQGMKQKYWLYETDLEVIFSRNPLVEIFENNSTNGLMDLTQFIDALNIIKNS